MFTSGFQDPRAPVWFPAFLLTNSGLEHGSRISALSPVRKEMAAFPSWETPRPCRDPRRLKEHLRKGFGLWPDARWLGKVFGCILVSSLCDNRFLRIRSRLHNSGGHSLKIPWSHGILFCWETHFSSCNSHKHG